jgi:hypothetical protein
MKSSEGKEEGKKEEGKKEKKGGKEEQLEGAPASSAGLGGAQGGETRGEN